MSAQGDKGGFSPRAAARAGLDGIIGYFVAHRTAANLLLALLILAGAYSALNIRSQFFPDVVIERVTVSVAWRGAGPEDVDDGIIAVLEPPLLTVEGVDSFEAVARDGSARMMVEFEEGWDMGRAADEVKSAVDGVASSLPENAEEPVIRRVSFRNLVTDVVIWGPVALDQLARYADELKTRLFEAGATRVSVQGYPDPEIRVSISERDLLRYDLTLQEISDAVLAESAANPAGEIGDGSARVRAGTDRRTVEALADATVRALPDGSRLTLGDLASVEALGAERGLAYQRGDDPALLVRVQRSAKDDAIRIQGLVEEVAAEYAETLPEGVSVQLTRTRADIISQRLDILYRNGAMGLALVLLFLYLFLSLRTAFWVAAGIPVAMAATVALMYSSGLTVNMVSLFALIITLGIVVDDAIVVGEHADHLSRHGMAPDIAAASAARRMSAPVFSASITTVVAFAGLTFIGGRFGSLIIDIPLTVCAVMIASLVECFLILPAHMSHALKAKSADAWWDWPSRQVNRGFRHFRENIFRPALFWLLKLRYPIVGAAIGLLLFTVAQIVDRTVPWRFFNAPERSTISANIAMATGASRDDTRAMLAEMQRALDSVDARYGEEYGAQPVLFSLATIGGGASGRDLRSNDDKDRDLLGGLQIELIDPDLRVYSATEFMDAWQAEIKRPSKLEILSVRGFRSGPGGDAIDVQLSGADGDVLKAASEFLMAELRAFPAVTGLEDSLAYDKEELQLELTPKGEALGFTTAAVARALRNGLEGIEAAEYPLEGRTATVVVRLPEEEVGADWIERAKIRSPGGGYAALSEIVTVDSRLGFASVRREDGRRFVDVTGDVSEDDPQAATEVDLALRDVILPGVAERFGVEYKLSGLAEQEQEFLSDASIGFALCLAAIYLVLTWVFASWRRPLVVMLVIPFGLIGAVWGHYLHDVPLSMFSVVGLIGMSGIIINDSIVLVTTIDKYAKDRGAIPAIIDGACDRLRAVFLTTLTTVGGLAPLLFEQSRQALFLKPTVITLSYGLGAGLLLVLVITPSVLAMQRDVGMALSSMRRMGRLALGRRQKAQTAR